MNLIIKQNFSTKSLLSLLCLALRKSLVPDDINEISAKKQKATNLANQLLQKLIPEVQQTPDYIAEVVTTTGERLRNIEQVNISVQALNETS